MLLVSSSSGDDYVWRASLPLRLMYVTTHEIDVWP